MTRESYSESAQCINSCGPKQIYGGVHLCLLRNQVRRAANSVDGVPIDPAAVKSLLSTCPFHELDRNTRLNLKERSSAAEISFSLVYVLSMRLTGEAMYELE